MRNIILLCLCSTALFLLACSSGKPGEDYASCYYDLVLKQAVLPDVYIDALNFCSERKNRVDIYVDIPYMGIKFLREGEFFVARYTTQIDIVNPNDTTVDKKEFSNTISLREDEKNNPGGHDMTMKSFHVDPGPYTVKVKLTDENIQRSLTKKRSIQVPDFASPALSVSDLMLIREIREEKKQKVIVPAVNENVSGLGNYFYTFCEVYSRSEPETLLVRHILTNLKYNNDVVAEVPTVNVLQKPYLPVRQADVPFSVVAESVMVQMDSMLVTSGNVNQLIMKCPKPPKQGTYRLGLHLIRKQNTKDTLKTSKTFTFHGVGFPAVVDVDDRIEAFEYVAKPGEMRRLVGTESKLEREKLFGEMWADAGTWKMMEYYKRVEYANELFTCNVDGWKTPMGMVFIVLGEPSYMECSPGSVRVETWSYPNGIYFAFESTGEFGDGTRYYTLTRFPEQDGYRYWLDMAGRWRM